MNNKKVVKKLLYRDPDNAIIAGVAAGLGKYFDTDPAFIRIGFVLSLLLASLGFWIYIILWIVLKKAETPLQKQEMNGIYE